MTAVGTASGVGEGVNVALDVAGAEQVGPDCQTRGEVADPGHTGQHVHLCRQRKNLQRTRLPLNLYIHATYDT